jgi:hypothetical protein
VDEPLLDSGSDAAWEAGATESGPRASRIWQPNDFLEEVWPKVAAALERAAAQESSVKRKKVAVDVGCGSGRDLVWLALQLGPEWEVVGLDNHKAALERAMVLAESEGVADRVSCASPPPSTYPKSISLMRCTAQPTSSCTGWLMGYHQATSKSEGRTASPASHPRVCADLHLPPVPLAQCGDLTPVAAHIWPALLHTCP